MIVCAIIFTNNSAQKIENIVLRARAALEPDIYVMDAASTDDTLDVARIAGAGLLSRTRYTGPLVIQALKQVRELGYTHAILLNANNDTHRPEMIPMFVNAFWQSPRTIFVAAGKQKPRASVSNALLTASAMCTIRDAWNGFRGYPVNDVLRLKDIENAKYVDAEILVRASWAGLCTRHLELDTSCPDESRIGNSPEAIWFSLKLFGRGMVRYPALLRRRLAL
ncbi:MAG: hypothetical protein JXX14_08555 [Deltaproteobacteria bacterium]|nr:hypothetical protein [Deltaproteobacteria bacterium]